MLEFFAISGLINGMVALAFGLFGYLRNRKRNINRIFGLFHAAVAVWGLGYWMWLSADSYDDALFWVRIFTVGSILLPIFYVHWLLLILGLNRVRKIVIYVGYTLSTFFVILIPFDFFITNLKPILYFPFWPQGSLFYLGYVLTVYVGLTAFALIQLSKELRISSGQKREQVKYLFIGSSIAIISGITNFPQWFGVEIPPFANPIVVLYIIIFAYAMIRHRLMDIRIIITRSIVYFFLVLFVTAAFASIILLSTTLFKEVLGVNTFLISAVGAIIVVVGLDPLKRWLSDVTDQIFFKARIDYQQLTQNLSVIINKEYEVLPLVNAVTAELTAGLKIKSASMMMKQKDGTFQSNNHATGEKALTLDKHSALLRFMKIKQNTSVLESLERRIEDTKNESERGELEKSRHDFETIGASVVSPIMSENDLKAILILGQKRSGDSFSTDEMDVMDVIGPQIATAIEKATLFDEVKDLSENLRQKVDQATGELQERNASLLALQNINNLITRSLEIRKVNQGIVDSIANELGYIGAILIYVDEKNNKLHAAAVTETGLTKGAMKMLPKSLYDYHTDLESDQTMDALAIKEKSIKIGTSMKEFFSPPVPKPIITVINKVLGVKTIIAIPLYSEGRVIGVLDIASKRSRDEISEQDMEVLEAIAAQTAIVARNLALFDQLKESNAELEEANAHLQQLDQAKTEFVSIASHQLRTPMTGIMGYLSMMTQGDFGKINPKHQKILVDLLSESQRMIRLINLFLNVSKIEAGKFDIDLSPMQMEEIIENEIIEVSKAAKEKGLKIIFKKPKKKLKPVMGDVDKIKDVVLNLLDNGIKYTTEGSLTITVEQNDHEVHVGIKDTGIGIKPSDARELFTKFVRGSGIARIHPDGSGLGLFIAKKIIEAHHGMIWVESDGEGKGSTFQFVIPNSKK